MEKKKIIFFFASQLLFIFIIILIMIVSIPNNPISFRYKLYINRNLNALLPEGWAFFTRDCKEEQIFVYKINSSTSLSEVSFKTSNSDQLFGFIRHNRMMHSKLSSILSNISDSYYYTENISLDKININKVNRISVKISNSNLCGQYLVKLQKPKSWTWYSSGIASPINSYKLVLINFKCNEL